VIPIREEGKSVREARRAAAAGPERAAHLNTNGIRLKRASLVMDWKMLML
jgi:hypothetical protein